MSDRAALLAAIRADPRDDALRLVYADWLEEHGNDDDRELAAAIRSEDSPSYEQKERWLGSPLNDSGWKHSEHFHAEFRRGMVERLVMPAEGFLELAETLVERFPAFHRLVLTDLTGRSFQLAACQSLGAVSDLTVGDPLLPEEALDISESPHLRGLRALRIWAWGDHSHVIGCLPLVSLPALEEVELLQVNGGIEGGGEEADQAMDEIAGRFAEKSSAPVRVVRPYAKKFPLDGDVWSDLFAGHTRDGRPTLVLADRQARLLFFDDDGRLVGQEECDLDAVLVSPPEHSWERYNEQELLEHLRRLYGFELGRIHIREISLDEPVLWIGIRHMSEPRDVLYWHEGDNFEINYGGGDSWWAGPDGKVHST